MKTTAIKETKKFNYSVREAFKTLRTNFLFCGDDIKTVLITSCVKNEGKSTISIELSKSLALSEKKVLLIDSDLRKSVFATKYTSNEGNILGLSEYLSGQAEYDDVLYSTDNENLHMIFAGAVPPNPVELLGSNKFRTLVKQAREQYDYVIIDAAPLGAVIDASAISAFVDGAILVVTANEISYRFAQDIKIQLEKSDCKVLGAILNRIPMRSGSYYNNYYKKYYGRYKKYGYGKYGKYGKYGQYGGYYGGQYGGYGYGEEEDFEENSETETETETETKSKSKSNSKK
ncbi:MAG: CpsD/CapB family tyrosine-protein kinase [Ruminococcaceae bacterium]|nr:CpsD/CapB family tyrosine-protein kinase [Oscillospiraceae bacterium]